MLEWACYCCMIHNYTNREEITWAWWRGISRVKALLFLCYWCNYYHKSNNFESTLQNKTFSLRPKKPWRERVSFTARCRFPYGSVDLCESPFSVPPLHALDHKLFTSLAVHGKLSNYSSSSGEIAFFVAEVVKIEYIKSGSTYISLSTIPDKPPQNILYKGRLGLSSTLYSWWPCPLQ